MVVIIALSLLATVTAFAKDVGNETPVLGATVIRGVSAYTTTQLYETYRDQLGKPISREQALAIAAAVEQLYVHDGYSKPTVRVEGNLVSSGMLRLEVIEPQFSRVTIGGDTGPYANRIESAAGPLRNQRPVRRDAVQRVLQRLRELPGLSIVATTRRDDTVPGGFELLLNADYQSVEGVVQATNRGTQEIGPFFILGQTVANSLFGHAEKLGLIYVTASDVDEFKGGGAFIDLALGGAGTRGALNGFRSLSKPNEEPVDLTDEYLRDKITLKVTHPLRFDSSMTGAISGMLDMDDLEIERDGVVLRDERLRIVEAGARLSWRSGTSTQYLSTLEVRKGFDGLGAQLYAADLTADPRSLDFVLTRLQLVRLAKLDDNWSWRIDALAQQSGYVLPYSERFKIGGERLGRGFEVTEIAGDRGIGAKAELRRDLPGLPDSVGSLSAYGFYDYGATWKQDVDDPQSAATLGIGLGVRGANLTGYLEVAMPLTHADVEGDESAKVFAEVSYKF